MYFMAKKVKINELPLKIKEIEEERDDESDLEDDVSSVEDVLRRRKINAIQSGQHI